MDEKIYFNNLLDIGYRDYQNYYLIGLHQLLGNKNINYVPGGVFKIKFLLKLLDKFFPNPKIIFDSSHGGLFCNPCTHVGQYIFISKEKKEKIKFAIDSHDSKEICSKEILKWSDIYFKSNRWSSSNYPKKVFPIVNGNGILSAFKINYLKSLRNKEKKLDLVFISRVWGGREHNIRIFEELAKIRCKKKLLAIFPSFKDSSVGEKETLELQKRLECAGVPWTYEDISASSLWNQLARSKLVILRAGKHLCIPWRMIDLLCLGSCIVYDSDPYPNWPIQLKNKTNYFSLGIKRPRNKSEAPKKYYEKIPGIIKKYLENERLQQKIRNNNIDYFEKYASPKKVAEYILDKLDNFKDQVNS